MRRYIVQIPVQPNILAGIGSSTGDGLPDDYDFNSVLRTRAVIGAPIPTWYLDFSVEAKDIHDAIRRAWPIAYRFVQFIAFVYDRGFEIDIAGSTAKRVDGELEISDYGHIAGSPANLDEMVLLWNHLDEMGDAEESGKKNLIRKALEWIHRGKTMTNPQDTLLAYVTALEILLDSEKARTVVKKKPIGRSPYCF